MYQEEMDILKIFNIYDNEIKINIIGTLENPLFQANQIGKLLGLKNIHETIKNFDEDEKDISSTYTIKGNQKTTFLTEIGLYRLLGMSRKEEARIFQKWICNVVKELRLTGKYELDNQKEDDKKMYEKRLELERHKTLITSFHNKTVIYICILDNYKNFENTDLSLYKIGYSNNIKQRVEKLEIAYGPMKVLYIFECVNNTEFEKFLFSHKDISKHRYKKNIIKTNTREIFLLSPDNLYDVLQIIKKNIENFQKYNNDQFIELKRITLENNKVKLEMMKLQNDIDNEIINNEVIDDNISVISELRNNEDLEELTPYKKMEYEWVEGDTLFDVRKINNTKSPYIQKYDPDTFELLETFDSLIDLTRTNENISKSGLKNAVKSNTIYAGFRWLLINKSEPNIKYDLEPTNDIVIQKHNEYIAMIDINKKYIVEVFASQKDASISRKFTNGGAISLALKRRSISSGHYWIRYDECSDELKATYTKPLPDKNKKFNSKKVELIHKTTKEIIKIYQSIDDVLKEFQMSRLTLNRVHTSKDSYKGFLFRIIE